MIINKFTVTSEKRGQEDQENSHKLKMEDAESHQESFFTKIIKFFILCGTDLVSFVSLGVFPWYNDVFNNDDK